MAKEFVHKKTGLTISKVGAMINLLELKRYRAIIHSDIHSVACHYKFSLDKQLEIGDLNTSQIKPYYAFINMNILLNTIELKIDAIMKEFGYNAGGINKPCLSRGLEFNENHKEWIRVDATSFKDDGEPEKYKIFLAGKVYDKVAREFRMKFLCKESDTIFETISSAIKYYYNEF